MKHLLTRRNLIYLLTITTTVIYLVWRGVYTLPWNESLFALLFGLALWLSEIVSNLTAVILIWSKNKAQTIEKPEVGNMSYPDIDVLIATHNEEPDLLFKTVNGAINMAYPDKEKVHIYISDDMNRPEVKALAKQLNVGYIGLEQNQDAKSGNLNNALSQTNSPLIATFDADMIPYSNFLMETVPYFIENKKQIKAKKKVKPLGLVQTPQSFYNADSFQFNLFSEQDIPNEQDFFSREVNVFNNAHGAAIYTGSNTVISRQAIEDAGGFPTDTITEDFELGALINMQGYKNISTLEPLASGLTPTDVSSVLKQRIRWARGVVQSVRNLKIFTSKDLTFQQKIVYLNSYLYWWSFLRRILYIFAPILFTVFNIRVVDTNFWTLLLFWLPSYCLIQLVMKDISSDVRTARWGEIQETIFAPYLVLPVLFQTIGLKETKFKVTDKGVKQSKRDVLFIIPHMTMLVLALYGVVVFNYGKFGSEIFYGSVITFWLLSHIFNLTIACLYYLGRPIYRTSERFLMQNKLRVTFNKQTYELTTHDISETGLSFTSEFPYYFPSDQLLKFTVVRENYHATFTGKIVRVWQRDNTYYYGVVVEEMTLDNYRHYLQIIYDGFNQSLRQTMDPMVTMLDSFVLNIKRRANGQKDKPFFSEQYPVIFVNQTYETEFNSCYIHHFNYREIELSFPYLAFFEKQMQLKLGEILLALNYQSKSGNGRYVYYVENLSEWLDTPELHATVEGWLKKEGAIQ